MNDIFTQPTDQDALRLAHSIALAESGTNGKPNYNASGDVGTSKGAYQWQPGNYEAAAKKYGLDPSDFSPTNQDKVAYAQVKEYKDKGYQPAEIASIWNSGRPDKYENHSGDVIINGQKVHYDTPAYVKRVQGHYQELMGGQQQGSYNPKPYSNPGGSNPGMFNASGVDLTPNKVENPDSLTSLLNKRQEDASAALNSVVGGKEKTGQTRISGVIQTAGALAGGLGDITGKVIELVPGVKQLEGLLGEQVGKLAETPTGQKVASSIQRFSQEHPELAKDIGAGFNIVTAIPILRGLGVIKSVAKDATATALKGVAEKSFAQGLPEVLGNTQKATRLLEKNPNIAKEMLDRRLIGDIKDGKFVTKKAVQDSWSTIEKSNNKIGDILSKTNANKITIGTEDTDSILANALKQFPESNFTPSQFLRNGKSLTPQNGKLWDKFERGDASLGDINKLRSDLDNAVKSVYVSTAQPPIKKEVGKTLADSMRVFVKDQAPETAPLFKEMSTQFDIQKALTMMSGKSVKPGGLAKFAGHAVGISAGGGAGALVGGPTGGLLGGMIGEKASANIAGKLSKQGMNQSILKRTGNNATRTAKKSIKPKLGGLIGASLLQNQNR